MSNNCEARVKNSFSNHKKRRQRLDSVWSHVNTPPPPPPPPFPTSYLVFFAYLVINQKSVQMTKMRSPKIIFCVACRCRTHTYTHTKSGGRSATHARVVRGLMHSDAERSILSFDGALPVTSPSAILCLCACVCACVPCVCVYFGTWERRGCNSESSVLNHERGRRQLQQ